MPCTPCNVYTLVNHKKACEPETKLDQLIIYLLYNIYKNVCCTVGNLAFSDAHACMCIYTVCPSKCAPCCVSAKQHIIIKDTDTLGGTLQHDKNCTIYRSMTCYYYSYVYQYSLYFVYM